MNASLPKWSILSTSEDSDILQWADQQTWARDMASCQQDPGWHAEGDVWTHTQMVCQELFKLDEWSGLPRQSQIKLLLTAIFHDSGKPATTRVEEGTNRIRSPKHAQFGTRIARRVLMELGCDFKTREEICRLVLFHGRPPYLEKQESPQRELIKLSWYVDHRLLYLFALADTRGRITDTPYSEDTLNLWKLVAEENQCLDRPYQFTNSHARFLFFRGRLDNLHYTPHEDYRCKMTIMVGLPGAGKDSWLKEHRSETPVISLDEFRKQLKISPTDNQGQVVQAARERCREHLRNHQDFVLNATNTTRQIRQLWIDIGADYGAKIEIVYIEPDLPTLIAQNQQRVAKVPDAVIERLIEKLDPPSAAECHEFSSQAFTKSVT